MLAGKVFLQRITVPSSLLLALWAVGSSACSGLEREPLGAAGPEKRHIVFVTGDDEYRSEFSMPMVARILESSHNMRTSLASAQPTPLAKDNIAGLEALASADLAVIFLRWRTLPEEQLRPLLDYTKSGKPLVGLRTTTHSFRYPEGHAFAHLNDGFGIDIFGQKWISHHGHSSSSDASVAPGQQDHPVLRGVESPLHVRSWLYVVDPLHGDSEPLLIGRAVNPERKDHGPQPVAWTKTYKGARVFFTTLGHPADFELEPVRRLLINGIYWALGLDVPPGGVKAGIVGTYDPPSDGFFKTEEEYWEKVGARKP